MSWKQKPPLGTPLIPKHPHLDGLAAWWLFQEGGGDQVYDLSGNGNTGTLNNFAFPATASSGWNSGKFGSALAYDGANDFIDTPADAELNGLRGTVSLWVLFNNTFRNISSKGTTQNKGWIIGTGSTDKITFQIGTGAARIGTIDPDGVAATNTWYHIAGTWDGSNVRLYKNGIEIDVTVQGAAIDNDGAINIGQWASVAGFLHNGLIDDFRVYNRALTAGEMLDIYTDQFAASWLWPLAQIYPPVAAPVVTYYPDLTYPDPPLFPQGHDDVPIAGDFYTATTSQITALAAEATLLFDQIGNIELGATEGVGWNDGIRIDLSGGEIQILPLQVSTELVVDTPTLNTLNVTGDIVVGNDLTASFAPVAVGGVATANYVDRLVYKLTAQIDEPGDPADNTAIFWMSSGVGFGDAADFCCKITEGGGTTSFTISDYSAL